MIERDDGPARAMRRPSTVPIAAGPPPPVAPSPTPSNIPATAMAQTARTVPPPAAKYKQPWRVAELGPAADPTAAVASAGK